MEKIVKLLGPFIVLVNFQLISNIVLAQCKILTESLQERILEPIGKPNILEQALVTFQGPQNRRHCPSNL